MCFRGWLCASDFPSCIRQLLCVFTFVLVGCMELLRGKLAVEVLPSLVVCVGGASATVQLLVSVGRGARCAGGCDVLIDGFNGEVRGPLRCVMPVQRSGAKRY